MTKQSIQKAIYIFLLTLIAFFVYWTLESLDLIGLL